MNNYIINEDKYYITTKTGKKILVSDLQKEVVSNTIKYGLPNRKVCPFFICQLTIFELISFKILIISYYS